MNGLGSAQGCGVLTWECVGSLAGRNIFLSVPLDGFVLLFLCLCLQGARMAWRGSRGGPSDRPTKEVASPGHCKSKVSWG